MKLARLGDSIEDRVIEEAATISLATGEKLVDLGVLKSVKDMNARQIGLTLQKKGFGRLIEVGSADDREYHFGMAENGYLYASEVRKAIRSRTLIARIGNLNWNAVNAIAASIAAIAALIAAYYSYLSFVTEHVTTH